MTCFARGCPAAGSKQKSDCSALSGSPKTRGAWLRCSVCFRGKRSEGLLDPVAWLCWKQLEVAICRGRSGSSLNKSARMGQERNRGLGKDLCSHPPSFWHHNPPGWATGPGARCRSDVRTISPAPWTWACAGRPDNGTGALLEFSSLGSGPGHREAPCGCAPAPGAGESEGSAVCDTLHDLESAMQA